MITSKIGSSIIAKQIIVAVVLFSTLITFITTAYQLYGDYTHDINKIENRLAEIKSVHLQRIIEEVWISDPGELNSHLEGLMNLPDIVYIKITENNKELVAVGKVESKNILSRTYPLNYNYHGENILLGELYVQASLQGVYQHIVDQIWEILVANAIKTFLVSGFILLLIQFLLTRHLHQIAVRYRVVHQMR